VSTIQALVMYWLTTVYIRINPSEFIRLQLKGNMSRWLPYVNEAVLQDTNLFRRYVRILYMYIAVKRQRQ
jgi:hypothetical protein